MRNKYFMTTILLQPSLFRTEQHIRALSQRIPLRQEIPYLMVRRLATRFISPKFLRDTKQGIRGKNRHIGLSLSKRSQQEICLIFSKNMLHVSDRKEQHMNLIEKALRYIYIYILTSKAGLEYDLQSREVCERRSSETDHCNRKCSDGRGSKVLCTKREDCDYKQRIFSSRRGEYAYSDLFRLVYRRPIRERCNAGSVNQQWQDSFLPRRRLTSKEVAA